MRRLKRSLSPILSFKQLKASKYNYLYVDSRKARLVAAHNTQCKRKEAANTTQNTSIHEID